MAKPTQGGGEIRTKTASVRMQAAQLGLSCAGGSKIGYLVT